MSAVTYTRLPGVIDRHVHLGLVDHAPFSRSAVVEVHDLGWSPSAAAAWKAAPPGDLVAVRAAGPFHTAPGGYPTGRSWAPVDAVRSVADAAAARSAVAALVEGGFDAVKITLHTELPLLGDDVLRALVEAAHDAGLPALVHAEGPGQAARAIEAGADVLVHAPWTETLPDDLLERAAAMTWISTLAIHDEPGRTVALDNVRRFRTHGGTVVYGTDMGNGPTPVGPNPTEIRLLERAGLTGDELLEAVLGPLDAPDSERTLVAPLPRPRTAEELISWLDAATRLHNPGVLVTDVITTLHARAVELDATDPLAPHRDAFVRTDEVIAYLDGNSLGRPVRATRAALAELVDGAWGDRLIRSWDEQWMDAPTELGDRIGRVLLGAASGQTVVGDSTSVMLYKLAHAALDAQAGRDEVVACADDFPTDRFVIEGLAAERGLTVRWLSTDPRGGVALEQVRDALSERTALVLLSHISYRSAWVADMAGITAAAHDAGALVLWDLCHSVGALELALDATDVDLAVGCTYKFLNGGPGAPAFGYVATRLQDRLRQPIQGWMGAADPFAMGERYEPATGIRRFISGTPPILAMVPMRAMLDLLEQAGMAAVRAKSVALTAFAIEVHDALLAPLDVELASPRDADLRGGHVTLNHPDFREVTARLWERGVIPDFRPPHGLRVGLSPLSTSFAEVLAGLREVADLLAG